MGVVATGDVDIEKAPVNGIAVVEADLHKHLLQNSARLGREGVMGVGWGQSGKEET